MVNVHHTYMFDAVGEVGVLEAGLQEEAGAVHGAQVLVVAQAHQLA